MARRSSRYLWAIVDDPATSAFYQRFKRLPADEYPTTAYGETVPDQQSDSLPVRDVGVDTVVLGTGKTELHHWILRFQDGDWSLVPTSSRQAPPELGLTPSMLSLDALAR